MKNVYAAVYYIWAEVIQDHIMEMGTVQIIMSVNNKGHHMFENYNFVFPMNESIQFITIKYAVCFYFLSNMITAASTTLDNFNAP